ncbi:MAG: DUF131 domain-containing protein [Nitrososphaerota archaeon]|nr:DUF131 domain-containing protein [Nitrososphaerota archaeon]
MAQKLFALGLLVFLAGLGLVFAGTLGQGNASFGGVVFVGPFPIVFGSGPGGWILALGSVVIGAVMLIMVLIWELRLSHVREG